MLQQATSIDWLQITSKSLRYPEEIIPLTRLITIGEDTKPPPYFDAAYKLKPAGLFAHKGGSKELAMLRLTGSDLREWRKCGIADLAMLKHAKSVYASLTRLDIAVDLLGDGSILDLEQAIAKNTRQGAARTIEQYHSLTGDGNTLYFGSRKSEQFVRVYDKAAEQKLLNEAWTRVELQTRRKKATALAHDMLQHGIQDCAKERIQSLVDFPTVKWWVALMQHAQVQLTELPRTESSTMKWLREQVAPTFSKEHN